MSTFQERILAASVSPSGNPGNDSEQYRYRDLTDGTIPPFEARIV